MGFHNARKVNALLLLRGKLFPGTVEIELVFFRLFQRAARQHKKKVIYENSPPGTEAAGDFFLLN